MNSNSSRRARALFVSTLTAPLLLSWPAEGQPPPASVQTRDLCHNSPGVLRQCGVSQLGLSNFHSNLLPAAQMVLEGWSIRVQRVESDLGASVNPAIEQAARICRERGLDALAWTSDTEETATLWVYNHHHGDVVVRRIAPPPYSTASAVAVALSIKTALRDAGQTPPPAANPAGESSPSPLPLVTPQPQSIPRHDLPGSPQYGWLLEVSSGYRWGNRDPAQNGPRLQLELRRGLGSIARGSYAGLSASSSPPLALNGAPIDALLWDFTPLLTAGWTSLAQDHVSWGGHLGVGVRFSTLSGTLLNEGTAFSESRRSAVLSAGTEVATHWRSLRLALQPALSQVLRGRHYALDGQQLLAESTTWWSVSLGIGLHDH